MSVSGSGLYLAFGALIGLIVFANVLSNREEEEEERRDKELEEKEKAAGKRRHGKEGAAQHAAQNEAMSADDIEEGKSSEETRDEHPREHRMDRPGEVRYKYDNTNPEGSVLRIVRKNEKDIEIPMNRKRLACSRHHGIGHRPFLWDK